MQMDVVVAPTEGHNRMTRGTLGWEGGIEGCYRAGGGGVEAPSNAYLMEYIRWTFAPH